MASQIKSRSMGSLGRSWKHLTEKRLSVQDTKLLLSVKQLVESGLEQSHETKFKGANVDTMKKYNFNIFTPTGATTKLGIKVTRKQTVEETRLAIRKIDLQDYPFADCKRQKPTNKSEKNKLYCSLFGPHLCPDCVQVEDQLDFTLKQDKIYPKISVHTRYMVAGEKLTKKKVQAASKGIGVSPFKRHVDINVIDGVVTDEDVHNRLKQRSLILKDKPLTIINKLN